MRKAALLQRSLMAAWLSLFAAPQIHAQATCGSTVVIPLYEKDHSRSMWIKCGGPVPGTSFYEVERALVTSGIPDPSFVHLGYSVAPEGRIIDHDINDHDKYAYRIRPCTELNDCGEWSFSSGTRARLIWPFVEQRADGSESEFFEVHDAHNEVIAWGTSQMASDGSSVITGYHEGVDMNRSELPGARTKVLSPVTGVVIARGGDDDPDNAGLKIQFAVGYEPVSLDVIWEQLSFSHLATARAKGGSGHGIPASLERQSWVRTGDLIGDIGDKKFTGLLSDHTHVGLGPATSIRDSRPFFALYDETQPQYLDPKQKAPDFFDENNDGKVVLLRDHSIENFWSEDDSGSARTQSYISYNENEKPILKGDIAIHVEVMDEQGTAPRIAPDRIGYWIEGPRPNEKDKDDVRSRERPYVLFDFGPRDDRGGDAYFLGGKPIEEGPVPCWEVADVSDAANAGCPLGGTDYCNETPSNSCSLRDLVDRPDSDEVYRYPILHHYIVTNTADDSGDPASVDGGEHWRTNARYSDIDPDSNEANHAFKPTTQKAIHAQFPDGEYRLGVYMTDRIHKKTRFAPVSARAGAPDLLMRLENFAPMIEELTIGQDSWIDDRRFAESSDAACGRLLYDYEYERPPKPYPGNRHLQRSLLSRIRPDGGARLCMRIRFSESIDHEDLKIELRTIMGSDRPEAALEGTIPRPLVASGWQRVYSDDDEWRGIFLLPADEEGKILPAVGDDLLGIVARVVAYDLPDAQSKRRWLNQEDIDTPSVAEPDLHHRILLDEESPLTALGVKVGEWWTQ